MDTIAFTGAIVVCKSEEDVKKSFKFSQTKFSRSEREHFEGLEAAGRIRVEKTKVVKNLGKSFAPD